MIPQVRTEPQIAFFVFEIGKSPSSTICGTVSKPKYGVIRSAIPIIQPGIIKVLSTVDWNRFEKLLMFQCPDVSKRMPVIIVVVILANKKNACALTSICTSCKLNTNTNNRITMAIIMILLKLRASPNVRLIKVAMAITTAGGTDIQAAIINHEAKNPACLLMPTVL